MEAPFRRVERHRGQNTWGHFAFSCYCDDNPSRSVKPPLRAGQRAAIGQRVVSHLHLLSAGQRGPATDAHTIGSDGGSSASRSGGSSQVRPDIRRKRSKVVD